MRNNTKIFMLDNLDSFTYNLVDELNLLGFEVVIYRNTLSADYVFEQIEQAKAQGFNPAIVLSPGPGNPASAGCLMALIKLAVGRYPILGICLGHQALVEHYGGRVSHAPEIVHGKSSNVNHCGQAEFAGLTNPLPVARYHSLSAVKMPSALTVTAEVDDIVMAIKHEEDGVIGFQFHPESVLTTQGSQLLQQSIAELTTPVADKIEPKAGQ